MQLQDNIFCMAQDVFSGHQPATNLTPAATILLLQVQSTVQSTCVDSFHRAQNRSVFAPGELPGFTLFDNHRGRYVESRQAFCPEFPRFVMRSQVDASKASLDNLQVMLVRPPDLFGSLRANAHQIHPQSEPSESLSGQAARQREWTQDSGGLGKGA